MKPTRLFLGALALAACGDHGAPVQILIDPAPTAVVFHDADGRELSYMVLEQPERGPWLYEVGSAATATAGWIQTYPPGDTYRALVTMRGLGDGDSVILRRYPSDRSLGAEASGPTMSLTIPRHPEAFDHEIATPCQRQSWGAVGPIALVFPPGCVTGGTTDVVIAAHTAAGFSGIELRDQAVVDGGALNGDGWQAGATIAMSVRDAPLDLTSIAFGHATVAGDFEIAETQLEWQTVNGIASRSIPVLPMGDGALRKVVAVRADPGGLAVVELTGAHDPTWEVDLGGAQPPRLDSVAVTGTEMTWNRGDGPRADVRVASWNNGTLQSTWDVVEPDEGGERSERPPLPATFDDIVVGGFTEGGVRLIDFAQLSGYSPVKSVAHQVLDLGFYGRDAGYRGMAPVSEIESFASTR